VPALDAIQFVPRRDRWLLSRIVPVPYRVFVEKSKRYITGLFRDLAHQDCESDCNQDHCHDHIDHQPVS